MQNNYYYTIGLLASLLTISPVSTADNRFVEAIKNGQVYGNFRLRYENVDQNNDLDDANALTLRSRLGYKTDSINGFSAQLEFEDVRAVLGVDSYNDTLGQNPDHSVIADPESTEIDQGLIQYQGYGLTAKFGRQLLTYDNHRFIGSVGWRQDRQTFDGITFDYQGINNLSIKYAYLEQRNRIFSDEADIDSRDHLLNISYNTSLGRLVAYSYLLEEDTSNELSFDTYGLRFTGSYKTGNTQFLYTAEYATQERSARSSSDLDTDYYFLEGGISTAGITAKIGYEVLGSDDGLTGFATPLATVHKFNGWADLFIVTPNEGLVDAYLSLSTSIGKGKFTLTYHDFSADDDTAISDDFGSEIDALYSYPFGKHYTAGIKYASYNGEDPANDGARALVDTDKFWVWVSFNF